MKRSKKKRAILGQKKRTNNEWRAGEKARRRREVRSEKLKLLSKIYANRTVGFCQSKRQSRSMHRELRVGTKILEFRQTLRGREFSYIDYF